MSVRFFWNKESSLIITAPAPSFTEPNDNIVNSLWELTLRGYRVCTAVYRCTECRSVGAGQLCLAGLGAWLCLAWQDGGDLTVRASQCHGCGGRRHSVVSVVSLIRILQTSGSWGGVTGVRDGHKWHWPELAQVSPEWPASERRAASVSVCCGQCEGHSEKYFLLWSSWLLLSISQPIEFKDTETLTTIC